MKTAKQAPRVQKSTGNVFADLGLHDPQEMIAKAELANRICQIIENRGLTQSKAGELLGMDQPKISALVHGKLKGFSMERLIRCLGNLGHEIQIIVRPARPSRR